MAGAPAVVLVDPELGELATTGSGAAAAAPSQEPPVVLAFSRERARTQWPVAVLLAGAALVVAGLLRRRPAAIAP